MLVDGLMRVRLGEGSYWKAAAGKRANMVGYPGVWEGVGDGLEGAHMARVSEGNSTHLGWLILRYWKPRCEVSETTRLDVDIRRVWIVGLVCRQHLILLQRGS